VLMPRTPGHTQPRLPPLRRGGARAGLTPDDPGAWDWVQQAVSSRHRKAA
jgi:hypothetical protein